MTSKKPLSAAECEDIMGKNQTTDFGSITVSYEDKWVRITCDSCLKQYLLQKGNGSLALADYLLEEYQKRFQKPLQIKRHSLAIEILAHTYTDTFSKIILDSKARIPSQVYTQVEHVLTEIRQHTGIIDCGEKSVDTNRFLWDELEPFHTFIYGLLGPMA